MPRPRDAAAADAASITRRASTQSYLTMRWLADREYRQDALAFYAYFRWLDDTVDECLGDRDARLTFVGRQRRLLGEAARGSTPTDACAEENLLVSLALGADEGEAVDVERGEPPR